MSTRILASAQAQIRAGEYYEAHQKLRTLANRYIKTAGPTALASPANVQKTLDLLSSGAAALLDTNQAAAASSGADLVGYLLDVYDRYRLPPADHPASPDAAADVGTRWRTEYPTYKRAVTDLLVKLPARGPLRGDLVRRYVAWSTKYVQRLWILDHTGQLAGQTVSHLPPHVIAGDPEVHHWAGTLLGDDGHYVAAEAHLLLGIPASAGRLGRYLAEWSAHATAVDDPGQLAARAVLQYLALNRPHAAYTALDAFVAALDYSSAGMDDPLTVHRPTSPILDFCQLLLLAVERRATNVFTRLRREYPVVWGQSEATVNQVGGITIRGCESISYYGANSRPRTLVAQTQRDSSGTRLTSLCTKCLTL
ncbi:hypothetical protein IWQ60_002193 [Tieghemiomyces parasiticus]|uniref:Uncharacterized protein n=1 Tax=Tieghemiomyces parasiticus TaxID=78921 RepID=A0A9W8ACR0_9FUNG|nr:hypothetical protein IWQ60_002193 [Tieghemiomyces parasiticus]